MSTATESADCPDLDGCYERLLEDSPHGINAIRSALVPFYPTADEQDQWLEAPHPLLRGRAAGDLVGTDQEYEVWALIDQLESGAFV